MKHTSSLALVALLLAPAGALLSGCGGGNGGGLLGGTGSSNQGSANLSVTQSSGSNFGGSSTFTASKVLVFGSSTNSGTSGGVLGGGFSIQATDAGGREVDFDGTAITSGSFSAGQSFDLTQNQVFASVDNNDTPTWGGIGAQTGTLTVKSVSGTRVTFQLSNLALSPLVAGANGATGTLTFNGTITATIPVTATTGTDDLKRKHGN